MQKAGYLIPLVMSLSLILFCGKKGIELKPYGESAPIKDWNPPKRNYWPTKGWKTADLETVNMDPQKISEMEEYAFNISGTEEDRLGTRTDSVVIIKDGYLVYEKYARGYNQDDKHLIWSIAKSYINALVGVAQKQNQLSLDDPAHKYVEELNSTPEHKDISIRHLITMSSGLSSNEGYESNPLNSTVISMLYTSGRNNMGSYSANLRMRSKPGEQVYYSSCDTNILSLALKNIYGEEEYSNLPWKEIFSPLGIEDVTFEQDGAGVYVGSSYIYTKPRDLAKFGYLYLNNGIWENQEILSKDWVNFTRTPSVGYPTTKYYIGLEDYVYTAQWYTNTGVPEIGVPKPMPDVPDDILYASGHWGQRLFVIPSHDMVVVRLGDDRDVKYFDNNRFLKLILESIK